MRRSEAKEALRPYLVGKPHPGGDYDAHCPLHEDDKRSARINFKKGVWKCFAGCGGGSLRNLLDRMGEGVRATKKGGKSPKLKRTAKKVTMEDVKLWHRALLADEEARDFLWRVRYILRETIERFHLGWDSSSGAYTIPILNDDGSLRNVRKYRPGASADRKIWWANKKQPGESVPLYPPKVLKRNKWVVLCEGEMDALVAIQHGFPAISGTAGASTWHVEWSKEFDGKTVFIAYDRDATGDRAARMVAEHLEPHAKAIYIVTIPIDKKGADVSDFFLKGKEPEDFYNVLRSARRYAKRVANPMAMEPVPISVIGSFDASNVGRAMAMDVHVAGRRNPPYTIPKVVQSTCTMDAGAICKVCPMLARDGEHTFEVPPWSPAVLTILEGTKIAANEALREINGAQKCNRLSHEVQSYQSVEELYVRPSWDVDTSDFTNRKMYGVGKHDTLPSQVVRAVGTSWPAPREPRNQFLAWEIREVESAIDEFRITPDMNQQLRQFSPKKDQPPLHRLYEITLDMERNVTRIYGRPDLHMAIALVYHSLLAFPFDGQIHERGWLDALIVGDTRTGKSDAARRMSDHYRAGKMINCEAATFAGIVGGLQQMGSSKEWTVTWGAVPMNDRRLVILDEASGLSYENIQQMSDVRSSGFILLQKIQQEQAWARTRLLWLANPRDESMDKYTYGVQAISPLIGNREDIARFDFAMALTSGDVSLSKIQKTRPVRSPAFSGEDCHTLVLWAWSRRPSDVVWERGAEEDVKKAAEWLGGHYTPEPPLIQGANVRFKIARMASALAACTFSADSSGKRLVIRRSHVSGALRFLHGLYKKDTFGYHRMSSRYREQLRRSIEFMDDAYQYLRENPLLREFLMSVEGQFRRDMLEQTMNYRREEANAIVNKLFNWGLVSPDTQAIKLNPTLHQLLREIEG
jgi:hypothetical protein